jgi:esterase
MHLADRLLGGKQVRRKFELEVLFPADAAFKAGDTEQAVKLLVEGINGTTPNFATSKIGMARRLENARAMRCLLASEEPFPQLDEEHLRTLEVPTLLLAGERTEPIHDAIFKALSQVMTQAAPVRIPACGHGAHRDNPNAFNEVVMGFVSSNTQNSAGFRSTFENQKKSGQ